MSRLCCRKGSVNFFSMSMRKEQERRVSRFNSAPTLIMLIRQFSKQEMKEDNNVKVQKDVIFNETIPGGNVIKKALENHIIMKQIVDFLNVGDFCRWYDSCEIFQDIIDNMDKSIWRGLANTLMMATGSKIYEFEKMTSQKTFLILRRCVEHRVKVLKDWF